MSNAGDWVLGTGLIEVESELLRKKHLARFSPEEVCLLLEEMGLDRLDLRGFRLARTNGEARGERGGQHLLNGLVWLGLFSLCDHLTPGFALPLFASFLLRLPADQHV